MRASSDRAWGIGPALVTGLLSATFALIAFAGAGAGTAAAAEPPTLILNSATPLTFDSVEVEGEAEVHGGETLFVVIQVLASEEGQPVESEFIQTIPEGETGTVPISGVIHRLDANTHYYVRLFAETAAEERFVSAKPYLQVTTPAEPPLAPRVTDEEVTSVTGTEAVLSAQVTPERSATTYRFEYIPREAFGPEEWASPSVQKSSVLGPLPADGNKHLVSFQLQGLSPGVPYLWRVTAQNAIGQGEGPTLVVGAYGPTTAFGLCPNSAFRVGLGAELPDCRAYEQATPTNKNGLNAQGFAAFLRGSSDSGQPRTSFIDVSGSGIPAGDGGRQNLTPLLSSRGTDSWSTQRLYPPESLANAALMRGMSSNLRFVAVEVDHAPEGAAEKLIGLELLDTETRTFTPVVDGQSEVTEERAFAIDAIGDDGSFVIFEIKAVLAPGAKTGRTNLYRWDSGSSSIELIGVLPSSEGGGAPTLGAFGGMSGGATLGHYVESLHAATLDGGQIYFTAAGTEQLYLRRGLNGPTPSTTRVSQGNEGVTDPYVEQELFGEPLPAAFQEATPDGSKAFFVSSQKLTADAATGEFDTGADLYRFDAGTTSLTDVTGGLESGENPEGARVVALLGASADGTSGYFVARGAIAPGATLNRPNIYRFEELENGGYHLAFVATLSNEVPDRLNWSTVTFEGQTNTDPVSKSSRVSPDGDELVFSSTAGLTRYDRFGCGSTNEPRAGACTELYIYSTDTEGVACISCTPTGEAPRGSATLSALSVNTSGFVSLAAPASYLAHSMSSDGRRLFFQTPNSLVPRDRNGPGCEYAIARSGLPRQIPTCVDVYEWEAVSAPGGSCTAAEVAGGCLYLLSAGDNTGASSLVDASSDGADVYIATQSPLVPTDRDELTDLYDVRTGGGMAPQFVQPGPPCEGEACRSPAALPAPGVAPGSSSFEGSGNEKPTAQRCKKGFVKRHGKCVKKKRHLKKNKHGQKGSSRGGQK